MKYQYTNTYQQCKYTLHSTSVTSVSSILYMYQCMYCTTKEMYCCYSTILCEGVLALLHTEWSSSTTSTQQLLSEISGSVAVQVLNTSVPVVWSMWSYDVVLHYMYVILLRMHVYMYTYYTTYASIRKYQQILLIQYSMLAHTSTVVSLLVSTSTQYRLTTGPYSVTVMHSVD